MWFLDGKENKYLQAKIANVDVSDRRMITFNTVTSNILYNMEKEHTDTLQVINATVSHELRNPLNSLISQNIEKKQLFKELKTIILNSN